MSNPFHICHVSNIIKLGILNTTPSITLEYFYHVISRWILCLCSYIYVTRHDCTFLSFPATLCFLVHFCTWAYVISSVISSLIGIFLFAFSNQAKILKITIDRMISPRSAIPKERSKYHSPHSTKQQVIQLINFSIPFIHLRAPL